MFVLYLEVTIINWKIHISVKVQVLIYLLTIFSLNITFL